MLRLLLLLAALMMTVAPTRAAEPVMPCQHCEEAGEPGNGAGRRRVWQFWNWPKDDGYERRKEVCRFVFGPAGPYLYPDRFRPRPTLDDYPYVKP